MAPVDPVDPVEAVAAKNDPAVVRCEYASERGLAGRTSLWSRCTGRQPPDAAFDELVALAPRRVLDVGCGQGQLAERLTQAGLGVVAVDQSEQMVALTAARGVTARVADVQRLPFEDGSFDAAVANYMLYHVPDLDRGLAELARVLTPGGTLVAATNGERQLAELWQLAGRSASQARHGFTLENGSAALARHFATVRCVELSDELQLTADEMRDYVSYSISHRHLAAAIPQFVGRRRVSVSGCVFVATR